MNISRGKCWFKLFITGVNKVSILGWYNKNVIVPVMACGMLWTFNEELVSTKDNKIIKLNNPQSGEKKKKK